MNNPKNNNAVVTTITKRVAAVAKYMKQEKATIPVQGAMLSATQIQKLYQQNLDARSAVTAGRALYLGAVKSRNEAEVGRLAADESLKAWVLARYGAGSAEAEEFGFAPRKPATVSAATRAKAVEQNLATRRARGTMPRKEKLKIKGVIPTPTAPAAPAIPDASAAATTSGAAPATVATTAPAPSAQVAPVPPNAPAALPAASAVAGTGVAHS